MPDVFAGKIGETACLAFALTPPLPEGEEKERGALSVAAANFRPFPLRGKVGMRANGQ